MRVRFWGTRGSLPVSATADTVTAKICEALVAASGRTFADVAEARAFAEGELPFAVHGTYGGHTSCVQIEPAGWLGTSAGWCQLQRKTKLVTKLL